MKLVRIIIIGLAASLIAAAAFAAPPLPKGKAPAFITSFGQSQDANFVNVLAGRIKLERVYKVVGETSDPGWNGAGTVIAVIGGSSKGLGSAGLNVNTEKSRCDALMKSAREQKKLIIGMHIGGESRRGTTSEVFTPYAGDVDYMIVKSDGNQDGYFTKLCADKKVPLYIIENTKELEGILKEIFGL